MIIQLRGTSGSGKSTVMTRIMERAGEWNSVLVPGRKKPLYYVCKDFPLIVLGHYESPCGGCDTIGSAGKVFELIGNVRKQFPTHDILCEGLLLSEDVKWSSQLVTSQKLFCVFLATDTQTCLNQIKSRREKVGNEKPLNPANTVNRVAVIDRSRRRLIELGVNCVRLSSNQAVEYVLQKLNLKVK